MAIDDMLKVLEDGIQDATIGLAAQVAARRAELGYTAEEVPSDFTFDENWLAHGAMHDLRAPNVIIRPAGWSATEKHFTGNRREAVGRFTIQIERASASAAQITRSQAVYATALMQFLDEVIAYSKTHPRGTLAQLISPVEMEIGDFDGAVTTSGIRSTITLHERSVA